MQSVNPASFAIAFLIGGLATYFGATTLGGERGPFDIFAWGRARVYKFTQYPIDQEFHRQNLRGEPPKHWVWEGINCPKCWSLYVSIPVAIALSQWFYLEWAQLILVWIGLAGMSRWLYSHE